QEARMHFGAQIRPINLAIGAAAAALAVGGCGGSSKTNSTSGSGSSSSSAPTATSTSTSSSASSSSGGSTLAVSAEPGGALKFNKTTLTAKAGKVTIAMTNPSSAGLAHGIAIQGNGVNQAGSTVQPGGKATVTATLK